MKTSDMSDNNHLTMMESTYSPGMGFIYVFNLIVGTGALTLPAAFAHAGWLVSLCIILILALISYVTLTFTVESMAAANAILRHRRMQQIRKKVEEEVDNDTRPDDGDNSDSDSSPTRSLLRGDERVKERKKSPVNSPSRTGSLPSYHSHVQDADDDAGNFDSSERVNLLTNNQNSGGRGIVAINGPVEIEEEDCDIRETVEMGKLAGMFFNRYGTISFFICIAIYLYGDLAIYGAAVGKSLRDTACTYYPPDVPCNQTLNGTIRCWTDYELSRDNAYRLFLSLFVMTIGIFGFFNVQKTMLLQIITSLVRWTAFIAMITLACIRLATTPTEDLVRPPLVQVEGLPNLFGACVYSFMCHHSLPSLLTPIKPKRGLYRLLALDYLLIAGFYLLLGLTGVFAFYPNIADLYTLNFVPGRCLDADPASTSIPHNSYVLFLSIMPQEAIQTGQKILFYFLSLFPVFTLSTSFPIIAITLRNNLKQLFLHRPESEYSFFVRRLLFPCLALIPPAVVAVVTSDVSFLVGITGSYAGAAVQYVVPAFLALRARAELAKEFSIGDGEVPNSTVSNIFTSPFRHPAYVWLTLGWAIACIAFVTYNHVLGH